MRQIIYEVLGAESGATLTEYDMFADICADSAEFAASLFGSGYKGKIRFVAGRSGNSWNLTRK